VKSNGFRANFVALFALIVSALFLALPGCGGGTTGTGSTSSTDFTGRLYNENGTPRGGESVVIQNVDGEAFAGVTGQDGSFTITVATTSNEPVTITVAGATTVFTASTTGATVVADLLLSNNDTQLDVEEVVEPSPAPEPTSTPSPDPTGGPNPDPTARPSPTPTAQTMTVAGNVEEGTPGVLENAKVQIVGRANTRTTLKPNGNFTITVDANRDRIGFRLDSRAGTGKAFIENLPDGITKIRVRLRAEASGQRLVINLSVKGATAVLSNGSEVPL